MFARLLHFFGRHDWSKWSNPRVHSRQGGLTEAFAGRSVETYQQRTCFICNLVEQRHVGMSLPLSDEAAEFLNNLDCEFNATIEEEK